jgi:hypothetical protein
VVCILGELSGTESFLKIKIGLCLAFLGSHCWAQRHSLSVNKTNQNSGIFSLRINEAAELDDLPVDEEDPSADQESNEIVADAAGTISPIYTKPKGFLKFFIRWKRDCY